MFNFSFCGLNKYFGAGFPFISGWVGTVALVPRINDGWRQLHFQVTQFGV